MATNKSLSPANQQQSAGNESENLINLGKKHGNQNVAKDLNAKLTTLEINLSGLTKRLESTDGRLRDLHSDTRMKDDQLTNRLDEVFAELREIQVAYKELTRQSKKLAKDTDKLVNDLEAQGKGFSAELDDLKGTSEQQFLQLTEEQNQLERRTSLLDKRIEQLSDSLDSRLTGLDSTIKAMEARFITQIENVASDSEARDNYLSDHIGKVAAEGAAALNALDQRVTEKTDELSAGLSQANQDITTLFGTTGDLTMEAQDLQQQVGVMDIRTNDLENRSDRLEDQNEEQSAAIGTLFGTTKRHFQWGTVSLAAIALVIAGLTYYQSSRWSEESVTNNLLSEQLGTQGTQIEQNTSKLTQLSDQALVQTDELKAQIKANEEEIAALKEKVVSVGDTSESANGRVTAMAPHRQFGGDNILHGPEWIAQQNAQNYMIELTTVSDKNKLYETVNRWGHYLKDKVAYYSTGSGNSQKYVLVYGNFADKASAKKALYRMPKIDYRNRASVSQIGTLLSKI